MNLLTKTWFAAVLVVLLQPALSTFVVWKSTPGLLQSLLAGRGPRVELNRPKDARPPWDMWTPEIEKITAELKQQREALLAREQTVGQQEARLAAEQAELARTRKEIETQRAEISKLLTEVAVDEAKNLRSLAQTYAQLTPPAAVAIFAEMDDTTVVKILSLMKADIVGPIFEQMAKDRSEKNNQAQRAASLSERLRLMKAKPAANS